jgi:G6PDH family F420-dependent oxidoreductase
VNDTLGYWLSSEEHHARSLVDHAVRAEAAGFGSAMISDHFHPWTPTQGNAPFVWGVLGAIAQATEHLVVGTGVSAAVHRTHPLMLAHAAATAAVLMPGRFFLGLGTGERLNEQITGERFPRAGERRHMLEEAVDVIRRLWAGDDVVHRGEWFNVEHAQLFTRPATPPDLFIAAGGSRSAVTAGRLGDGLIGVAPDPTLVEAFETAGGRGKPRYAQLHICWAESEATARQTALRWWPQAGLPPAVQTELARPADMAAAARLVTEDAIAEAVVCGPDPDRHIAAIAELLGAGFSRVFLHQVGPDQDGFFTFARAELLPRFV